MNQTDNTLSRDLEKLRRIQLKELESLLYFDSFCRKNKLTYYLLGGCVIGAVRHGGFIPWDDDIDVIMPRKDYEKLYVLWKKQENEERFLMIKPDLNVVTSNTFISLFDTSIRLKGDDPPPGIPMDIFPLDGCPDKKIQRLFQYFHAMVYSLFVTEVIPTKHGKLIKAASTLMLSLVKDRKKRYKIWKRAENKLRKYDFDTHKYCTELYAGPYYMRKKYPAEAFKKAVYKDFEGISLPLPIGYDVYLSTAFGDYMKLPPEKDRVPHHEILGLFPDEL